MLRAPHSGDIAEWAALREESRDFLTPWEPTWPADDLTRGAYRRRLKRYAEDQRADHGLCVLHLPQERPGLVGGLTLANIRRGVAQAGTLGYWVGAPFARRANDRGGARALRQLHHTAAAPAGGRLHSDNCRSVRLLEKNGFKHEGYAREYLCINGSWQDHLLYAACRVTRIDTAFANRRRLRLAHACLCYKAGQETRDPSCLGSATEKGIICGGIIADRSRPRRLRLLEQSDNAEFGPSYNANNFGLSVAGVNDTTASEEVPCRASRCAPAPHFHYRQQAGSGRTGAARRALSGERREHGA